LSNLAGFKRKSPYLNNMDFAAEIQKLKQEKNAVLLVHNYQLPEVQKIADFIGDSLELARKAKETNAEIIVFAGVDFMAETAKILNPGKKVLITHSEAKCPMAAQLTPKDILKAKEKHPDAEVVLYVNTSAGCKALADVCCTSANADKVVNAMNAETILFGPDANLAWFAEQRSSKKTTPIPKNGFCYVHKSINKGHVLQQKQLHPKAKVLVHPECNPEVQQVADFIGSTSQMLKIVKEQLANEWIVGTEKEMCFRLQQENPEKSFFPASETAECKQMKKTTLQAVFETLTEEKNEVFVPEEITGKAVNAIQKMLEIK